MQLVFTCTNRDTLYARGTHLHHNVRETGAFDSSCRHNSWAFLSNGLYPAVRETMSYFYNMGFTVLSVVFFLHVCIFMHRITIVWLSCLGPSIFLLQNTCMLFVFGFECTWWRLFQKRFMRIKFDIYVFYCFFTTFIWCLYIFVDNEMWRTLLRICFFKWISIFPSKLLIVDTIRKNYQLVIWAVLSFSYWILFFKLKNITQIVEIYIRFITF